MLQRHRDDIDADDEGDDEVQVVVCAQCVDHQAHVAIAGIVGQLVCFCWCKKGLMKLFIHLFIHYNIFILFLNSNCNTMLSDLTHSYKQYMPFLL